MSEKIREAIKAMVGPQKKILVNAKVLSVDKDKGICDCMPVGGIVEFLDARLKAVVTDNKGLIIWPEVDSIVLIGLIDNMGELPCVLMVDKIESITLSVGDSFKLEIDNDGNTVFNDGNNKGLVKLPELVDKINALEKAVNSLALSINTHTHICSAPTLASATALPPSTVNLVTTTQTDLENTKIKH